MLKIIYCIAVLLSVTACKLCASDSTMVLRSLVKALKASDELTFEYYMDAKFHNGDKDRLEGNAYMSMKDQLYFNECNGFTMLYTQRWFYRADHKDHTVLLIDLRKEKDKKLNKEREKNFFQNGALTSFLDSVMMQKGKLKQLKYDGQICSISMALPESTGATSISIAYDTVSNMPVSCEMVAVRTISTFDGIKKVNVNIGNSKFQKLTDNSRYDTDLFFTCRKNGVIELKKYKNYRLIRK